MSHIYRATRGKYKNPIPVIGSGIGWINEEDFKPIARPKKTACEHPNHWDWGKGTRNGQKLYYPTNKMFIQKWHMTKKELTEAIKQFDMASLEMKPRVICADCAEKIIQDSKSIS